MSKVGCPVSLSRHIIFPKINVQECKQTTKEALSNTLSFCVLLRSTLKVNCYLFMKLLYTNTYGFNINLCLQTIFRKNTWQLFVIYILIGTDC